MENIRNLLKKQIENAAGDVKYTYVAHWKIVNRLEKRHIIIKTAQILLTAASTTGVLTSLIAGIPWLSWGGGLSSAIALGLNLYMLNFNIPTDIQKHTEAANELWEVEEKYCSLLVDFEGLETSEIQKRRDELTNVVSGINKSYPGTDDKAFWQAQNEMGKYTFSEGEAAHILNS